MGSHSVRLCILVALLLIPVGAHAQGVSGQRGITFSVTQENPYVGFRFWVSNSVTLEPSVGYTHVSLKGARGAARYLPQFMFAYHYKPGTELRPYVGFGAAADISSGAGSSQTDISFGPLFGAEYFFSDSFSIRGQYQLDFIFTDNNMSPSLALYPNATYITTHQLLGVCFYF